MQKKPQKKISKVPAQLSRQWREEEDIRLQRVETQRCAKQHQPKEDYEVDRVVDCQQ